jgi:general secretion pathway protein K
VERGDGGGYRRYNYGANQYQRLLVNLGLPERQATELTASLIDWIDSDNRPNELGAEDYDYSALSPAYRAANTLVSDLSELTMIKGYGGEVYSLLKPYLCVGFSSQLVRMNVNGLRAQDAPMLAALAGPEFSVDRALDVISARPSGGYSDVADFWNARGFAGLTILQEVRQQTAVEGNLFESRIRVRFHDAVTHMNSMIYVSDDAEAQLLARRFGILN